MKKIKLKNAGLKGMAINISVLLMIVLIMLVVVFLLAGVFKDFVFQQHGLFGLTPGTETLQITDSDVSKKVSVDCTKKSSGVYEYTISIDELGFSYPSKTTVFPVFVLKGLTATSQPDHVQLPGRLSFSSSRITYNIKEINDKVKPDEIKNFDSSQAVDGKETVVVGFFKQNDECLAIAASASINRLSDFISRCAKTLEAETSFVATRKACG